MPNGHVQDPIREILDAAVDKLLTENRLRAILAAYERAKSDPQTKLPSYFMAALEAARR